MGGIINYGWIRGVSSSVGAGLLLFEQLALVSYNFGIAGVDCVDYCLYCESSARSAKFVLAGAQSHRIKLSAWLFFDGVF